MNETKITTFPWAPTYYQKLQQKHREDLGSLVPEITFVLYLCNAIRNRVPIEEIAAQANSTYPRDFFTWVDGKKVQDLALLQVVLNEATGESWRFVAGDWERGWYLTKKGLRFAKDVERRKLHRLHSANH